MASLFRCLNADKAEAASTGARVVHSQGTSRRFNLQIRSRSNVQLCSACKYWDNVHDVFSFTMRGERQPTSLASMIQRQACVICRLIAAAVQKKIETLDWGTIDPAHVQIYVGGAFEVFRPSKPTSTSDRASVAEKRLKSPSKRIKCVLYIDMYRRNGALSPDSDKKLSWRWCPTPSLGLQLLLEYEKYPVRLANVYLWEEQYLDTNAIKRWISECEYGHAGRCQKSVTKGAVAHFKLIDVDELRIVNASEKRRFVALSYMWNVQERGEDLQLTKSNVDRLSLPGGLQLQGLPTIISDAILLCRDLGERWLWVDRFCIVQDDPVTKGIQINAMDIIYGMAVFTLVAAVDPTKSTGLPGVRGRPRNSSLENDTRLFELEGSKIDPNFFVSVDKSTWNTRGWTFQERVLSTRCIYITDFQAYFTCPQSLIQEELGAFPQKDKSAIGPPSHFSVSSIYELATKHSYLDCACHYASRNLSFDSDIEKAFTGVSNVLATEMDTSFLFCLPERYFTTALLWHSSAHPTTRRKGTVEIPSWSWASWTGSINYNGRFSTNIIALDIGRLVTFHTYTGENGLRPLNVECNWFGDDIDFHNCAVLEDTNRRYTPNPETTEKIWRDCPHGPWEAIRHQGLDLSACEAAKKYPGSLVFNTTIAFLALHLDTAPSDDLAIVLMNIMSPDQEKIGDIQMDRAWIQEKVDLEQEHMFVVLCAGVLPKSKRRDLQWEQYYDREDPEKSPWLLIVMMVQQRDGVSERMGIGYVEARLWNKARPGWKTIVLA